jgi:predicted Zn-dependent peptidase
MTVSVTRLSSGLRVATDPMAGVETASVGVWVDAGARNESTDRNGISHLLEHMAFKGTRRRSARRIAEEIEAVGGHLNAYTSREQTAYFARVLADDVPLAVDILADILQHSTFDEGELERERTVIVQEIGQTIDTPDDLIFDLLQEAAFPGQAMGRSILGTAERVSGFDSAALRDHMATFYGAPRMVVVGSGKVEHDSFVALVESAFSDLGQVRTPEREIARYAGGEVRDERDLEQVHLAFGFSGVPFGDEDFYAAQVFSTVLGGGMSSRLFQEVREVRGLAYSVFAFSSSYDDCGLFGVYAGTGEQEVPELVSVVCDQICDVASGVGDEEVARARTQHKAGIMMALESSMARCEQLGRQLLIYGRPISVPELVSRIDAVDAPAVRRIARRITSVPPTVAAIGPLGSLESHSATVARFG